MLSNYIESRPDPAPWHPMDHLEPEADDIGGDDLERLRRCDPENLAVLLRVLVLPCEKSLRSKAIVARVVALAHCLHLEGIGDKSLDELAGKIGATKALLSHYICQLRDYGGLDHYAGKSIEGRAAYSAAQLWRRNREAREKRAEKRGGAKCHDDTPDAPTSM